MTFTVYDLVLDELVNSVELIGTDTPPSGGNIQIIDLTDYPEIPGYTYKGILIPPPTVDTTYLLVNNANNPNPDPVINGRIILIEEFINKNITLSFCRIVNGDSKPDNQHGFIGIRIKYPDIVYSLNLTSAYDPRSQYPTQIISDSITLKTKEDNSIIKIGGNIFLE
jgi:hypothetical protein